LLDAGTTMGSARSQLLSMQRKESGRADALRASCYCGGRNSGNAKLATVSFPQVRHVWAHVRNADSETSSPPLIITGFPGILVTGLFVLR
jgi:hypothetical protein